MIVYKITNTLNGKIYIGKTIQALSTRWSQHKSRGKKGNKKGKSHFFSLYEDMQLMGVENFIIEIIDDTSTSLEELYKLEVEYIRKYDSVNKGYNLIYGDLINSEYLTNIERTHRNKIISCGVKNYWDKNTDKQMRSEFARKTMHSISSEKRKKYIKKTWNSLDADKRRERTTKAIETKHKKNEYGIFRLISPDGIIYDNINNLTKFCKDKNLVRGGFYNLCNGKVKSYKGWTMEILQSPRKFDRIYIFTSPDGTEYESKSMVNFCNEHDLSIGSIGCIIRGICKQHKGWSVRIK